MLLNLGTNEHLLMAVSLFFFVFVVAEVVAAVVSNSLSLVGDAAAMSIDIVTYIGNLLAEFLKKRYGESLSENNLFLIGIASPLFSLALMIGVCIYVLVSAIEIIVLNEATRGEVNIEIVLAFAAINLVVDIVCIALFCMRRKTVFTEKHSAESSEESPAKKTNYNMVSAGLHVFCDTLRTCFMLTAAIVSQAAGIDGTLADAWASLAVSLIILVFVGILLSELYKKIAVHISKGKAADAQTPSTVQSSLVQYTDA